MTRRLGDLSANDYFVTCLTKRPGVVVKLRRIIHRVEVELMDPDEEKNLHVDVLVEVEA